MQEEFVVHHAEQQQMNGAIVGLFIGLASGLILFNGLGGAIIGGVIGLFGGTSLGSLSTRLSRTGGRMLIGGILVILAIFVVQSLASNVSQFFTSSAETDLGEFDETLYELEQQRLD